MRTISCETVISSGITYPFGQLSQSPGYISDSLLTRSPLCIATPCDLHVLATPPAFRLSQDQTLQLNFLASSHPHAGRDARTNSFSDDVYPRNEFVQHLQDKTDLEASFSGTPRRLGRGTRRIDLSLLPTEDRPEFCKAQTSFWHYDPRHG